MRAQLLIALLMLPAAAPAQTAREIPVPAAGNVTLPLDEYNRMLELAAKPPKADDGPPVPYVLKRAALNFDVGAETAAGTVQVDGQILAAGTRQIPLLSGMTIIDGQQGASPLPLEQSGGVCQAVLPGPADFAISLRTVLPLKVEAVRTGFGFPAPQAGAVQLTVTIPGDRTNVNLMGGLITARRSNGGKTTVEATLEPGRPAEIWWATREAPAPAAPRETRFLSDVKTLVSVSESALRLTSLVDVTIVQGGSDRYRIAIPAGFEVTSADGASIVSTSFDTGVLTLILNGAAGRMQQFLVSMEKSIDADQQANIPLPRVIATQRETGEVLVESTGALEIAAKESGVLKRMDLKEASPYLHQLAHDSADAAFRYHRQPADTPVLPVEWVRFPNAPLPTAIAERATVTTMVTAEGKSLTEVSLLLSNQAQPFLKVSLPAGATLLSADVAGQKVKPLEGPDGQRVPLLRAGFRPNGLYTVSFVFLHSGTPFARKGGSEIGLPKLDLPIGVLEWEVFLPSRFKVSDFGGNVTPSALLAASGPASDAEAGATVTLAAPVPPMPAPVPVVSLLQGQLGGIVFDPAGAVIPGVQVTVALLDRGTTRTARTDANGKWIISGVSSGRIRLTAEAAGFVRHVREFNFDESRPSAANVALQVGATNESVMVTSEADAIQPVSRIPKTQSAAPQPGASANVLDLQRRVAGVLPVSIEVPKTGVSYRFLKPLVVDEEATVSFTYKTK